MLQPEASAPPIFQAARFSGKLKAVRPEHDADRFPGEQGGGAFSGRCRGERLVGPGGQPRCRVGEPAEVADRERHLHERCDSPWCADLVDHEVDEPVLVALEQVGQPVQELAALPG